MTNKQNYKNVYQEVTNLIIEALEKGVKPWVKPWMSGGFMPQRHNNESYKGINILILWAIAQKRGYQCNTWMTYRQALALGGQVRKGEKSATIFYSGTLKTKEDEPNQEEEHKVVYYLKNYTVFNVEQIDGLPSKFYLKPESIPELEKLERIDDVDKFVKTTGAILKHGGARAFYDPINDQIQMPELNRFKDSYSYYSTLCHELIHWTKSSTRLDRNFCRKKFGDEGHALEELIAELGSAFLCADLNIPLDIKGNHAPYIKSWLEVLKNDNRAIFKAAAYAQRASDYLHELQEEEKEQKGAVYCPKTFEIAASPL